MLSRIFKNTASLVTASLIDKVSYVVLFAVIARKLTKSEFGAYNLVLTLIFIGGILVNFGMENVIIREVAKNRDRSKAFLINGLLLSFIFSILAWPLVMCLASLLHYGSEVMFLLSFGGAVFIFMGPGQIASSIIKAHERMEIFAIVGLCISMLALAANLFVLWIGWSLQALIVVLLATEGARAVIFIFITQRNFTPIVFHFDKRVIMKILQLTLPFALLMAYQVLLHRADLLMMGWLKPFEEVAIYGMAVRFADFLSLISGSMAGALYPALSAKVASAPEELSSVYNDSIGIFAILGFGATLAVTVLADPIIILMFGEKYLIGTTALRWLAWAFLFSVLSGPVGILLIATGDQMNRLLTLSVLVLGSNIILNLWLIPLYSYNGAALSTFLSAVVGFIGRLALSKKYCGQSTSLLGAIWRPLSASLLMACMLIILKGLNVLILVFVGGFIYFLGLALLGEFHQARYKPLLIKLSRIAGR